MPRSIDYGRVVLLFCLLVLTAAVGSCQRGPTWNLAPVEGTISQAGRPLAGIQVTFWADVEAGTRGPRASDVTDAAGHYELRTDAGNQGAVIGRYRVCLLIPRGKVRSRQANLRKDKVDMPPDVDMPPASEAVKLPLAYSRFAETPLRVEVHPGPQTLDFNVP